MKLLLVVVYVIVDGSVDLHNFLVISLTEIIRETFADAELLFQFIDLSSIFLFILDVALGTA